MLTKQEYQSWLQQQDHEEGQDRLQYHFAPTIGWLNDPNGLFEKDGCYHMYYQYSPMDIDGGCKIWGHTTTRDFIHYDHVDPFLYADHYADKDGVYSGSAYVQENDIAFYYTGNVKHLDGHYDYINAGREQNTIRVTSPDGVKASKKEVVLTNEDYPNTMSNHVRDPKIVDLYGKQVMLLGARSKKDEGCVLLYEKVATKWKYRSTIMGKKPFGYMWECPDIVQFEKQQFLITCPQGVQKQGYEYHNAHQCGYFPIQLDENLSTYQLGDFTMLDYGFDFYAPQTFQDRLNRTILIAWMAVPDAPYQCKQENAKWQHCMSIPRQLIYDKQKLKQKPLQELQALRKKEKHMCLAQTQVFENKTTCFEIEMTLPDKSDFCIHIREQIHLSYQDGIFCMAFENNACKRSKRQVEIKQIDQIQIFSDVSTLEIFINDGEYVLSTRVFDEACPIAMQFAIAGVDFTYYELKK